MGKRMVFCFLILAALISFFNVAASAESNLKWDHAWRIRHEYWGNWKDMDNDQLDNRNFFRVRTSLWGQMDYEKDLTLYGKLTDEFKAYTYYAPSSSKTTGKTDKKFHFDINEIVFDNLYMEARNVLDFPVDVRLGRQDFQGTYGEGFLIMDGTPQDGSRTFYFNALRAIWRLDKENTLDFIYLRGTRDDTYLPIINEDKAPQALNTTDEEGYILYWKNEPINDLALENYYIYKREDDDGGTGLQAQKGIINTLGSFAKYNFSPWTLRGQLAFQFGDYGNQDRTGIGGYTFLDRSFKDWKCSPSASLGFIYLSGDDRDTAKVEGWNPLFSRWPWMSDLYVMSMSAETGISYYWTNLKMLRAELVMKPSQKTKLSLRYNYLWADETVAASAILSDSGKDRGHLPQFRFDYTINKNISTYFSAEYLIPGSFYKDRDCAIFLRTEVQLKF